MRKLNITLFFDEHHQDWTASFEEGGPLIVAYSSTPDGALSSLANVLRGEIDYWKGLENVPKQS